MANATRKHKQHGIEINQVNFSGRWYTPVDDRIVIANHAAVETVRTQAGYSVVEHAMVPVGERWAYTCRIEYPHGSGHFYPGSDFIDLTAKDGLAKAETSAIGRALGLAGIAIESGIASADEMHTNFAGEMDEGERVVDTPHEPRRQQPQQAPAGRRTDQRAQTPHSLRLADAEGGSQQEALTMPRSAVAPVVTVKDCAQYADEHGLTREEYQRAVGRYGIQNPAYLLAALEEYVEKMAARGGNGKTPA